MPKFTPIGMRTKTPEGAQVINTCSDNDTSETGNATRWSWSNPTNRRYPAIHKNDAGCAAISLECLWQGTKIRGNANEPDAQTLAGDWRRGKGKKPRGAWNGPNRPLITTPGEARREIYLPAFITQIHRQLTENAAARALLDAAMRDPRPAYLRDFDTGQGIDRNGPMSHAWVLATILNGEHEQFGTLDADTTRKIEEIQEMTVLS